MVTLFRRGRFVLLVGLLAAGRASALFAHESRPGYLALRESTPGRYGVAWRRPVLGEMALPIEPVFPASCIVRSSETGAVELECPGGVAGRTIAVSGLEGTT